MAHDQLFKEVLRLFFREFMELFFPEVAARLNFATAHFLEQEVFTDFPDGETRRADTIVQVDTTDGKPEIVLFHIEVENWRRGEIRYRMWEYYALIHLRKKQPVYPIVIFLSRGAGGLVTETYAADLFGENILSFHYKAVGLPDLPSDDYRDSDNLLGVALSAIMRPGAISGLLRKWTALRKILLSQLDESRKMVLATVVENYLPLTGPDAVEYDRLVKESEPEVIKMVTVYEERGILKGIEQSLQREQELVLKILRSKFGPLSEDEEGRIRRLSHEELEAVGERIIAAATFPDLFAAD